MTARQLADKLQALPVEFQDAEVVYNDDGIYTAVDRVTPGYKGKFCDIVTKVTDAKLELRLRGVSDGSGMLTYQPVRQVGLD